ncbi:alpha/beta hydrolase [Verrucomicrobiales bacterium BCK34]|nr:alpha/beta hydrolase [Verrucomicrobiales bacterium BCK34]
MRPAIPTITRIAALILVAATLSPRPGSAADIVIPDDLEIKRNEVYKTVDGLELKYDLILPEKAGDKPAPFILHIHGGGWRGGSKEMIYHARYLGWARELVNEGVVFATLQYRRAGQGGATTVESLADCKDGVRFFYEHAEEFGIDPQRFGIFGGSAGGHLCLMTALSPASVYPVAFGIDEKEIPLAACVAYYPLAHFGQPEVMAGATYGTPGKFTTMLGGPIKEKGELAEKLSPINWLEADKEMPSILVLHGDADPILPVRSSRLFVEKAERLNLPVTYIEAKGGNHGFSSPSEPGVEAMGKAVGRFFREQLKVLDGE